MKLDLQDRGRGNSNRIDNGTARTGEGFAVWGLREAFENAKRAIRLWARRSG